MALPFAHGAIQWLAADAATTVYTVSGLSFQPVALRFYWVGISSATDAASNSVSERRGVGFAVSTSSRRCAATFSADAAAAAACASFVANDCVVGTVDAAGARDAELDLNSITSDGFTLIVDDQGVVDLTVFWEAWGGSDITVAVVGDIVEPAATGDQNSTVTGFVAGATDQVVMLAGVFTNAAVNSAEVESSGLTIGFAGAGTSNLVVFGQSDHASATMDTRGYSSTTECIVGMGAGGAASLGARATLTQFGTDTFTLNWAERGLTNRRNIFMAIKGGSWAIGSYTINGNSGGATATVSGLAFTPIGLSLMGRGLAADTSDTTTAQDRIALGSGSSTSSRRAMGVLDEDGIADSDIDTCVEYDSVLAIPSNTGTLAASYDINAMNSDGFQIIVDTAGGIANEWHGYLTFGNAPTGRTTKNTRAWPLGTEIGMGWRMECAS